MNRTPIPPLPEQLRIAADYAAQQKAQDEERKARKRTRRKPLRDYIETPTPDSYSSPQVEIAALRKALAATRWRDRELSRKGSKFYSFGMENTKQLIDGTKAEIRKQLADDERRDERARARKTKETIGNK